MVARKKSRGKSKKNTRKKATLGQRVARLERRFESLKASVQELIQLLEGR